MKKLILATLLFTPLCLFQTGVLAAAKDGFLHGQPFADLNTQIDNIRARLETLELQFGDLPLDLTEKLAIIDDNFNDITDILIDISDVYFQIEQLEARILLLEETGSELPIVERVVFSGHFVNRQAPTRDSKLGLDWQAFKEDATGEFSSIEISGSMGKGVSCSDPAAATKLAAMLNQGGSISIDCENRKWNVGIVDLGAVELNAGSFNEVNTCNRQEASVKPLLGSRNWGGIGVTCGAPSQTLEVILTR